MLVPVSVFSFLWLSLLEEDAELRAPLCGILVTSRYLIVYVYTQTLFYSFIFRTFLVLYIDRGLVLQGKPNLKLFNQLYWVAFLSYFAMTTFIMPGSHIIRGQFPEATKKGQICLLAETSTADSPPTNQKGLLIEAAFTTLSVIIILDSNRRVCRLLTAICPNRTYSCIGRYRRNLMSMKETFRHCLYWYLVVFIEQVFIFVSSKLKMDPHLLFLLYNSLNFLHGFAHFLYHSYCIQLSYLEISQQKPKTEAVLFFVSGRSVLEPRRPTQHLSSINPVFINHSTLARKRTRPNLQEFKRKPKFAMPAIEEIDRSLVY